MSSDEKVLDFPRVEVTPEESARRVMVEATRLASLALKEVIGRLHGIELGLGPEHTHLCRRKVADADRPNLALAPQLLQRPRGLRNRRLEVRPMHLIEINDISAQPSQRILDLLADASGTRVAIDATVFPGQSDLGGDRHLIAQRAFGKRLAEDLLGAAEPVDWRQSIKVTPRSMAA